MTDTQAPSCPQIEKDLSYADELIARAISKSSWMRNQAWVVRFEKYIAGVQLQRDQAPMATRTAIADERLILAFLSSVAQEDTDACTRVDSARRALNFVREIAGMPSLNDNIGVRLLTKSTRESKIVTVRQSPKMPVAFLHCMTEGWGITDVWWQRQTVLMTLVAFCSIGRGDEVCA